VRSNGYERSAEQPREEPRRARLSFRAFAIGAVSLGTSLFALNRTGGDYLISGMIFVLAFAALEVRVGDAAPGGG
jgi:hypothetical protein